MQEFPSDEELLARIMAGDQVACNLCIEKHRPNLHLLAVDLLHNEADAEDVVQESFLNAFKAIDSFEGRSTLSTWLYRITYNNALMRLRRKSPDLVSVEYALEGAEEGYSLPVEFYDWCCLPEEDIFNAEIRAQLQSAFKTLSPSLRSVFVYRELQGMSTRETADKLEVSEEVVKTRLRRARLQLREQLDPYIDPGNGNLK